MKNLITNEMIQYFDKRTEEHIQRVIKYGKLYDKNLDFSEHDKSKTVEPERSPYILRTWYQNILQKPLPDEIQPFLKEASKYHKIKNSHHPEHWDDINKMPDNCIVELVCDWCAMSEEFDNDPYEWLEKNKEKHKFNRLQIDFIKEILDKIWKN